MTISIPLCIAAVLLFPVSLFAQAAVSSGSYGIARSGFHTVDSNGRYVLPSPDMFRVEEFINYHRHDLPLPEDGQRVLLNVQDLNLENGKTVYQFGLTTPRAMSMKRMRPLNIVLVVDESGSMSGEKIENLKAALNSFVERFRKTDKLTIVGFEQEARIILEPTEKTKFKNIDKAIKDIHASGSTNLHAGLMRGYKMAMKNFDKESINRVIFLTDGNANVGVTESEQIAKESKRCIKKGISLVTIGLGVDFNNGLLREIADSGRGVMHYVGDARDIKKVFVDEIDGVLAPAARKVKLTLDIDEESATPKIYGYQEQKESKDDGQRYVFKLDDLNHGATQVVMVKSGADSGLSGTATLTYVDAITDEKITQSVKFSDDADKDRHERGSDKKRIRSVNRNYAIALLAEGLHSAAEKSNDGDNKKAEKRLSKAIQKSKDICSSKSDKHVKRVAAIATKYCKAIAGE